MKNLNICIDIDGTITDPYYWLPISNKYFNKNISIADVTNYEIEKVLGVSEEEYLDFYEKYKFIIHDREEAVREDAKKVVNELFKSNNIYFVTARDKSLQILTIQYLKKHNVKHDDLFLLGSHYKVEMAKKLNCDVFIEDNHQNAIELSQNGFKVLLIDTNYNKIPITPGITRIYNWNEVGKMVKRMLKEEKAI